MGEVEPLVLRRYARHAVNQLTDPELETPEPAVAGLWENPTQYAEQIRASLEPFETTLARIKAREMVAEQALKEKTEFLEEVKARLKWAIRLFEALFQLSGHGFHAERLRPSTRRSRSDEESSPETPEAEETTAEDATADGSGDGESSQPSSEAVAS